MKKFITQNSKETKKLGELMAKKIKNGGVICMTGDLGSGKTTFTQGLLKGLRIKGPYTSPTFVVIKEYKIQDTRYKIQKIYHIDAYRVKAKDILDLGWEEIIANPKNIIIIEWAERIKKIIPQISKWIKFKWIDNNKREIGFSI